jgi:hypothetical protein
MAILASVEDSGGLKGSPDNSQCICHQTENRDSCSVGSAISTESLETLVFILLTKASPIEGYNHSISDRERTLYVPLTKCYHLCSQSQT